MAVFSSLLLGSQEIDGDGSGMVPWSEIWSGSFWASETNFNQEVVSAGGCAKIHVASFYNFLV